MKTPFEAFGIECGEGWKGLYAPLIDLCTFTGNEVLQVKEKFGGLRFYYRGPYDMAAIVNAAEQASYHTCEDCGESGCTWDADDGYVRKNKATTGPSETSSWLRTRCEPCRIKWDKSREKPSEKA